jgi:hypothetical protein
MKSTIILTFNSRIPLSSTFFFASFCDNSRTFGGARVPRHKRRISFCAQHTLAVLVLHPLYSRCADHTFSLIANLLSFCSQTAVSLQYQQTTSHQALALRDRLSTRTAMSLAAAMPLQPDDLLLSVSYAIDIALLPEIRASEYRNISACD